MSKVELVQFDETKLKVKPKNLQELGEKCAAQFFEVKRNAAQALRWSYEIGREITEFAQRPEIVEAVERVNFPNGPKGPKKPGRPKTTTGYVIELLTTDPQSKHGFSDKWLLRCTHAYQYCEQKKLDFNKPINALLAQKAGENHDSENALPNPERLFPAEPKKGGKSEKGTPINREVSKICKHVEKFFINGAGHPRMRKSSDVSALLRGLHKVLKAHASAEVIPDQKA